MLVNRGTVLWYEILSSNVQDAEHIVLQESDHIAVVAVHAFLQVYSPSHIELPCLIKS